MVPGCRPVHGQERPGHFPGLSTLIDASRIDARGPYRALQVLRLQPSCLSSSSGGKQNGFGLLGTSKNKKRFLPICSTVLIYLLSSICFLLSRPDWKTQEPLVEPHLKAFFFPPSVPKLSTFHQM